MKIKRIEVNSSTYIGFDVENNDKDPKFKVDDHVRISIYKTSFGKGFISNYSEEVFMTKIVKK